MRCTSGMRLTIAQVLMDDGLDFARATVLADKVADGLDAQWLLDAQVAEGWERADELDTRASR